MASLAILILNTLGKPELGSYSVVIRTQHCLPALEKNVFICSFTQSSVLEAWVHRAWCTRVKRAQSLPPRSFALGTDRYCEYRAETRWEDGQGPPDSTREPRRFLFSGQPKDLPCRWLSIFQRRREVSKQEAEKVAHELRILYIQNQELIAYTSPAAQQRVKTFFWQEVAAELGGMGTWKKVDRASCKLGSLDLTS